EAKGLVVVGGALAPAIAIEAVVTGDDRLQVVLAVGTNRGILAEPVPGQHRPDAGGMLLGEPAAFGVLVDREQVAVAVEGQQVTGCVVAEPVVEAEPGPPVRGQLEPGDDVEVAAEVGEELAGGQVPVTFKPRPTLPAGQGLQGCA